jgi:hypothetical protein
MVRRGEPLSQIGRSQPPCGRAGCSEFARGFPARCRAATDPADGIGDVWLVWLLDLGDRPGESGEFAGGRDGDDRAALRACLEAGPGAVQPSLC